jgi:hypothetical protein
VPIYHGSTKIGSLYYGSTSIKRVYHGSTLVFEKDAGDGFITSAQYLTNNSTVRSSSAYATKGTILDCLVNLAIDQVDCYLYGSNGVVYNIVIAKVNKTGDTISQILATESRTITATSGFYTFPLSSSVIVAAGDRIAIMAVRKGGTATAICEVSFPADRDSNAHFSNYGSIRYASNSPGVGDAVLFNNTNSTEKRILYRY